jgi:ABC-type amino acid transport substrate-binding protein
MISSIQFSGLRRACQFLLGVSLTIASLNLLAGPVIDRIKQSGKIVIALREASAPFSYLDGNKKPVGYSVDLCLKLHEAIRKQLNLKSLSYEFIYVSSTTRFTAITEGKADLECGSTTNTAERREKVAFTIPHYIAGARFMVRADSPINELKDFTGRKIVTTKDTTSVKD